MLNWNLNCRLFKFKYQHLLDCHVMLWPVALVLIDWMLDSFQGVKALIFKCDYHFCVKVVGSAQWWVKVLSVRPKHSTVHGAGCGDGRCHAGCPPSDGSARHSTTRLMDWPWTIRSWWKTLQVFEVAGEIGKNRTSTKLGSCQRRRHWNLEIWTRFNDF